MGSVSAAVIPPLRAVRVIFTSPALPVGVSVTVPLSWTDTAATPGALDFQAKWAVVSWSVTPSSS